MISTPSQPALPDGPGEQVALVEDVWKSYGAVPVLKSVTLALHRGEVHALLGGNGAGKSTLMKILAGLVSPNAGRVEIGGQTLGQASPALAHQLGLYLVPQEAHILANQSVLENICLGLKASPRALRPRVAKLVAELSVSLDLDAQAATLEIADRQIVEILRGLIREARVLILDEPTSALTPFEVGALFERIRMLRAQGVGIFFISHKLREIREICDTISVLRDGEIVLSGPLGNYDDNSIVDAMSRVAGTSRAAAATDRPARAVGGEVRLSLSGLSGEGFHDISFDLHAGEILGLAGVVGAGRTELAETIFGLRVCQGGGIRIDGRDFHDPSPRRAIEAGLVYLPEDRQKNGLFLEAPLFWNASSYVMHRLPFFVRGRAERARFNRFREDLGIKCTGPDQEVRRLSGGNQQKVLLSKCLSATPRILVLDEPTRGVDVAARNDIYGLIRTLAAKGVGVLLISSDFDEIERMAERALVMAFGGMAGEIKRDVTVDGLARLAFGVEIAAHA